jgi:hypothetical protein
MELVALVHLPNERMSNVPPMTQGRDRAAHIIKEPVTQLIGPNHRSKAGENGWAGTDQFQRILTT